MTPRQQSPGTIRREWATWRTGMRLGDNAGGWLRRSHNHTSALLVRYGCVRHYADARALRRYLCGVGDNE